MFTDCSGECKDCVISYHGCCLAGHGDDDFTPITIEDAETLIRKGDLEKYEISYLKKKFPKLRKICKDNQNLNNKTSFEFLKKKLSSQK